jgi:hypothetical protein
MIGGADPDIDTGNVTRAKDRIKRIILTSDSNR